MRDGRCWHVLKEQDMSTRIRRARLASESWNRIYQESVAEKESLYRTAAGRSWNRRLFLTRKSADSACDHMYKISVKQWREQKVNGRWKRGEDESGRKIRWEGWQKLQWKGDLRFSEKADRTSGEKDDRKHSGRTWRESGQKNLLDWTKQLNSDKLNCFVSPVPF